MESNPAASHKLTLTGRILSWPALLFLLFDSACHILKMPAVVEWHSTTLGFPAGTTAVTGFILFVCIILYLVPRTSILGAIILTGYLGGAVAANMRIECSVFHLLLPIIVGILLWGKLFLNENQLRFLIPLKRNIQ
jgi:hypothetical protein